MAYEAMKSVSEDEYLAFRSANDQVTIEDVAVHLAGPYLPTTFGPPEDYLPETETVWSFPTRGDWATHRGNYRGNWSPYVPRNVILRYTNLGDTVLDQMCGSGTTLVECRLLGRRCIGVDINPDAVMVSQDRLCFEMPKNDEWAEQPIETYIGDARRLDDIKSDSIDLVATHPPYAGIVRYSKNKVAGDLSALKLEEYFSEMVLVAAEAFRVLRPGGHCAILIGDSRKHLHYIPISHRSMQAFLEAGFVLREDIVKIQWKTKTTRERWRGTRHSFYKIAHEHLFVFRKPEAQERTTNLRQSKRWW